MNKNKTKQIISLVAIFVIIGISSSIQAQKKNKPKEVAVVNTLPKNNSLEDRIVGLSKLWSEVKYNFVNLDKVDFDIDSLYQVALSKVISASNDIEYYDVLQRFLAPLNDGHTQVLSAYAYNWNEHFDYIPCIINEFDKRFYITSIRKDIGIDSTLLYSEIIEVEGVPTLQYVEEELFPTISASTYSHRLMQGTTKLMQGIKYTSLKGKVRKQTGDIVNFSIVRNGETIRTENDKSWKAGESFRSNEPISLDWDNDIAILQINTFYSEKINHAIDSLANIIKKDAKGLIIDLRYNGGGISPVARHLQMYITDLDSLKHFGAQKRINDSYGRAQGNYREEYKNFYLYRAYENIAPTTYKRNESITPFSFPIVVLMGSYSFSACEDFLVNIYEMPDRPLLIGESTGGSTGAPLMVSLPNDGWARICSIRITYPYSDKPFVGEGVRPDIEVKQTLDDYINNRDVVKQRGLDYLRNKQ